jgi:hypothetical protein
MSGVQTLLASHIAHGYAIWLAVAAICFIAWHHKRKPLFAAMGRYRRIPSVFLNVTIALVASFVIKPKSPQH